MRSPGYVCDHVTETLAAVPTGSDDSVAFVSPARSLSGMSLWGMPDAHVRVTYHGAAGGLT